MCDAASEMPKYIGVKIIWAIPMTREAFEAKHGRNVGGDKHGEGYEVAYEGGYQAWSPRRVRRSLPSHRRADVRPRRRGVEAGKKVARRGWMERALIER